MQDKFIGCLLGLAYGDAICAAYEGGIIERLLWRLIGRTKANELRFTDDTQMSLDIAQSFITQGKLDQNKLAYAFAKSYQWSRGYGPSAAKVLKRIRRNMSWQEANVSVYENGSFGNGAAMRAPVLAMCFKITDLEFEQAVIQSSEITHANSLAIEGALLIAHATAYALYDISNGEINTGLLNIVKTDIFKKKLRACQEHLQLNTELDVCDVKKLFGNEITAEQSCITAIYLSMKFRNEPFLNLLNFIKKLGGDTDTIAAMSGAIWGAFNGAEKMQESVLPKIEKQDEIKNIAVLLHNAYVTNYEMK